MCIRDRGSSLTAQPQGRRQKLSPNLPGFGRPARPRNRSETPKNNFGKRWPRSASTTEPRTKFRVFHIPRGSTEPTNGCRVCIPGLSIANFFANGRKRLTEKMFPSPLSWASRSGIIRPETNAPHWVQRAGFGQPFIASAQKVMFHGGVLRGSGVFCQITRRVASLCRKQRS